MDTVVINMNGSTRHEALALEDYGDELMWVGWNPQLTLPGDGPGGQINRHVDLLAELVSTDVDTFLKKIYEYQC